MSDTFTFWPKDIVSELPISPLVILKEAATELGKLTQGAVEAEVEIDKSASSRNDLVYDFKLISRSLGFTHYLFYTKFEAVLFYPVELYFDGEFYRVENQDELRMRLVEVLGSPKSIQAVKSLAAQASAS